MHPTGMRAPIIPLTLTGAMLLVFAACNHNQSPQQLREKTAEETAALKRDTTAVAEGVKDGLTDKSPQNKLVDLNKATKTELTTLPGIDARRADRIIAERPYSDKYQTVTRGALSDNEYARIQDQITIGH
jgi:DNA uptake protein ComE-like DNA-binding protein